MYQSIFPAGKIVDATASNADAVHELATSWRLDQRQLEPGRYSARFQGVHTARLQLALSYRSHSTWVGGRVPAGSTVFFVLLPSRAPRFFGHQPFLPGQVGVMTGDEEFTLQLIGASQVLSIAVNARLADHQARQILGASFDQLGRDGLINLRPGPAGATLGVRLHAWLREAVTPAVPLAEKPVAREFENLILKNLLGELDPIPPVQSHPDRRRLAMAADEYLRQRPDQPLGLPQLCATIGGSPRTVQIGYRETFGLSLKAALQALRFNGARRDLHASRGQKVFVKEVALKWGFMHLGRFSVGYRRWFGEGPGMALGKEAPSTKHLRTLHLNQRRNAFSPVRAVA